MGRNHHGDSWRGWEPWRLGLPNRLNNRARPPVPTNSMRAHSSFAYQIPSITHRKRNQTWQFLDQVANSKSFSSLDSWAKKVAIGPNNIPIPARVQKSSAPNASMGRSHVGCQTKQPFRFPPKSDFKNPPSRRPAPTSALKD